MKRGQAAFEAILMFAALCIALLIFLQLISQINEQGRYGLYELRKGLVSSDGWILEELARIKAGDAAKKRQNPQTKSVVVPPEYDDN
ncbi:MAG: hypothetical protein ABH863_02970 [Candidatus Micrarchaeota archaeon]